MLSVHAAKSARLIFWGTVAGALLLGVLWLLPAPVAPPVDRLVINEFVAANHTGLTDEDGDASDWIEIYNPGTQPVNLAGWSLTDDPNQPEKWTFPNLTLAGNQYLLVFASGKNRVVAGGELHTNFKLERRSEFLGLYSLFAGQFVDVASPQAEPLQKFPQQFADIAYGRPARHVDELIWPFAYLSSPTPGRPNNSEPLWAGLVEPVDFSRPRGFYESPFTLELTSPTPGATIRYTLDGSLPTETGGALYTGPIAITSTSLVRAAAFRPNFRPAPANTHTYIFLDNVLAQPNHPPGFPASWGASEGAPVRADYEMDPEIVNGPHYQGVIKQSLTALPSLSIVTDMPAFYDLYANPRRRGQAWERAASVEWLDPQGGQEFQINAGLRLHGELGRSEFMPKHNFRLFFRREYGAGKLNFPLFPGSPVTEFDTLVLRAGVNRSFAGYPNRPEEIRLTTYTRDEWLRQSQLAMSGSAARGRFAHLYVNGLYWGLYNLVERPDDAFMAAHFGGSEAEWQTISHEETLSHNSERFAALHRLAAQGRLDDPERYQLIQTYLDVPHFIDYLILNWYAGNLDWGFNNWYAGVHQDSGPIKYFVWDGERTWFEGAEIYMELDEYLERPNLVKPLLRALLANPDFKMMLADRLYRQLTYGALTDTNAQARWLRLNQMIEPAIVAESARWGDTRFEPPLTQADWFEARDDVLTQMEGNAARLVELARQAGYYPPFDPPQMSRQKTDSGWAVSLNAPEGVIYYTTNGADPRQPVTGQVSEHASAYRAPLTLTAPTQLRARVLKGQVWSALAETAIGFEEAAGSRLQITEIMYNPPGGDDFEFIELKNTGELAAGLAGVSVRGIDFTFPADAAPLPPGQLAVLVRNAGAFARRYPGVTVAGVYQGRLANSGEKLALVEAEGQIVFEMAYADSGGWPLSADGRGDSLVRVDLNGNPADPTRWRASANPLGSPGVDELGL